MTGRLLLVDDDEDVRQLMRLWLRHAWTIDAVATGAEGLERCRAHRYDAIVLDQRLPHLTGLETARRLRERGDDTPIVLFSAFLDPTMSQVASELGLTLVAKDDLHGLVSTLAAGHDPG